jgi:chromosome segregation ATPase
MEINNKNLELNNLQKKYNLLNNELIKLKQDNLSFRGSFGNLDEFTQYKKNLINANKEIERLNKVINVIEIDLNSAEEAKKEKDNKIEQLIKEINELKNELLNSDKKNKKLLEENNNKENIINKYENEKNELINKI